MGNVKPKKRLGQHFLKDRNIARKIATLLPPEPETRIVEIGPGTGMLTRELLDRYDRIKAVEVDNEAFGYLESEFSPDHLHLFHKDFLKWNPAEFLDGPAWFAGNLPYNITSPILFHLLEFRNYFDGGVFMVQKEVGERICASSGSKIYGILSVLAGSFYEVEYAFTVSEKVFIPPPKVKSAVITFRRKESESSVRFTDLKTVVKQAFGQRRKTLRNALKGLRFKPFTELEIFFKRRAEQLSITDFELLTSHLLNDPDETKER